MPTCLPFDLPRKRRIPAAVAVDDHALPRRRVARFLPGLLAACCVAAVALGPVPGTGTPTPSPLVVAVALLVAGGILSGFLSGLLGIGGALVTLPVLHSVLPMLGVPAVDVAHAAVLAGLVAMVPTTVAATIPQWRHGAVDVPTLRALLPAVAVGAMAGTALAVLVSGTVLVIVFAAQGLWCGVRMLIGCSAAHPSLPARLVCRLPPRIVAGSFGSLCASVGLGCGPMATPFLLSRGLAFRSAVATASVLSLAMAMSAGALRAGLLPSGGPHAIGLQTWVAGVLVGFVATTVAGHGVRCSRVMSESRLRSGVGAVYVIGALAVAGPVLLGR